MPKNKLRYVIVGDIHLSARNDSSLMMNHQISFFEDTLFPYLKKHKIKHVLTCGDLFDRRKFTSHIVLAQWKQRVFDVMKDMGIDFTVVIGNHDCPWSNSLEANSPSLMLREYDNITVIDTPTEVMLGNIKAAMIPWMCKDNWVQCSTLMDTTDAKYCFGHFDIQGFEMHRGVVSTEGHLPEKFNRFEQVISGHFHSRSQKGNVLYVGTPYALTWADAGELRGFHVMNGDDGHIEFVPSHKEIFNKIVWDDKDKGTEYYNGFQLSGLENTYVKVIVINKTDPYQFDKFLTKLYSMTLADLKVMEDMSSLSADEVDDEELEYEDTMTLVDSYVESVETDVDKTKIKTLMKALYLEALSAEV
jgi:DNA repair exonuclease SbcCD nuclease subunit